MKNMLQIPLELTEEQSARLRALQLAFSDVCNALAPTVRDKRCWHRVTLHHLAYRELRAAFPGMGSQMICNAIYAVSLASRAVYQHPDSPFNVTRRPDRALPLIQFSQDGPVFYDRHTLSVRGDTLSLYTLDGRMRVRGDRDLLQRLDPDAARIQEIRLVRLDGFELGVRFADEEGADLAQGLAGAQQLPDYLAVQALS